MDQEQVNARLQSISDAPLEERSAELEELIGVLETELESTSSPESPVQNTP